MCDVSRRHIKKATHRVAFFVPVHRAIDPQLVVAAGLVDDRGGYRANTERMPNPAFVVGSFWLLWCAFGNGTVP
jgi:hypothetical protein